MQKEVNQDEESLERAGPGQGGCLLDQRQESRGAESWEGMPQVKEVKDLSVAGPATDKGRYGRLRRRLTAPWPYLPIFFKIKAKAG
jgi:hypothetical protein